MFTYDQNTGDTAFTGDRVKICHTGSDMDGLTGRIGGWGDNQGLIALVILDKPYTMYTCRCDTDEVEVVGMPVVCLKKTVSKEVEQKWARFTEPDWQPSKDSIGNLCCESVAIDPLKDVQKRSFLDAFEAATEDMNYDADGYTIWHGGNFRPVEKDVIVAVKVRCNIPRTPVRAGLWPQICWMHRHKDDDMNKWDIVAYKVVK